MGNGHVQFECRSANICGILGSIAGARFVSLAFQGLMGVSSVLWGAIAEFGGNSLSLLFAGIGLLVRATRDFPMAVERDQGFGFETIFTLV